MIENIFTCLKGSECLPSKKGNMKKAPSGKRWSSSKDNLFKQTSTYRNLTKILRYKITESQNKDHRIRGRHDDLPHGMLSLLLCIKESYC